MKNITTSISISKAWEEKRKKCFAHFDCKCLFCDNDATDVHHRNYANIGKEEIPKDLSVLCNDCHNRFHDIARNYWRQFIAYVEEKGTHLLLFPNPDWNAIYNIQIDSRISTSDDILRNADAVWLVAYRDTQQLQANLCMRSAAHYNLLKEQKGEIEANFDDNLGELRWVENGKRIGFLNNTVGHVNAANRKQEFSWLHDRLVRLQEVFRPRVLELQISPERSLRWTNVEDARPIIQQVSNKRHPHSALGDLTPVKTKFPKCSARSGVKRASKVAKPTVKGIEKRT